MKVGRYLTWARSLGAPRKRLLPGLGSRLGCYPRLATAVLTGLRSIPNRRLRRATYVNVSKPLVRRMTAQIDVRLVDRLVLAIDTSDFVGGVLAAAGMWEPHVTRRFRSLLSPGDVFVDVGAYIGYYTLLASRLVGPEGHVYALEPTPATYQLLCDNLARNRVTNVTALCVAAGAAEGQALLRDAYPGEPARSSLRRPASTAGSDVQSHQVVRNVDVRPVGSVVRSSEQQRVRLVKIDVEGYEAEVLVGLQSLFDAGARPALLVEVHAEAAAEACACLVKVAATQRLNTFELVAEEPFEGAVSADGPLAVSSLIASRLGVRPTTNLLLTPRDPVPRAIAHPGHVPPLHTPTFAERGQP